ncbi:MAG TPA: GNAT family N-acetyltransferase [Ktedonobacteraceae bacterium]|jgi:ribosomal protein S18 acetylase RimI-like enzyme
MPDSASPEIAVVRADELPFILPELVHLLQDTVASGASVGFLPPLNDEDAQNYWNEVFQDVARGTQVLLVAREAGQIIGSVQLALAAKPNARHRAEVQKLFVLQTQRRRGTGRALMQEIEHTAREHGRTLLVLDTRQGDAAEKLYRQVGYIEAGVIPAYARSATGELDGSIFFYKLL